MDKKTSQRGSRGQLSRLRPKQSKQIEPARDINRLAEFPAEDPYPVLRIAKDGAILYSNQAGSPILKRWQCERGQQISGDRLDSVAETLSSRKPQEAELECEGKVYSLTFVPVEGADFVNVYGLDITARKQSEEEREVMIKLLSLINSSDGMYELMRLVSVFLKDWSECEAVGIRFQDGEDFPYFVTSGFPEEFVKAENKLCSVNEIGELVRDSQGRPFLECMCGNVISGRFDPSKPFFTKHGSFWTNSTTKLLASTTEADRLAKTRNRCNTAGYESVALVPLRTHKETFGLLQFNDKRKGCFTPDRIAFFERLAGNLAIGLAQRKAERELRTSETRLSEAMQIARLGHWEYDVDKDLFTFNDQFYSVYRTSVEQVGGYKLTPERYAELFLFPEDVPNFYNEIRAVTETTDPNFSRYVEQRVIFGNGETGYVSVQHFVIKDSQGRTIKTYGVNQDITERKRAEQALKKAENEKATILNTMSELVAYQDAEHRVVWANRAAGESVGSTAEKLLGRYCYEVWQKRNKPCANCPVERAWKTGRLETEETHSSDGRVWSIRANPVKNKAGNVIGVVEITLDITERKQVEQELQHERDFAESLVKTAQVIVLVLDTKGRIVSFNPYMEEISGYRLEEVQGKNWFSTFLPKRDQDWVRELFLRAIGDIQTRGNVNPIITKDGCERHIEWYDKTLKDSTGDVIGLVCIGQDITERKKVEESLRASEARYRSYIDVTSDIAWVTDADGNVIEDIPSFRKFTGQTYEQAKGSGWTRALHPDDVGRTLEVWRRAVSTKSNYVIEYRVRRYDGEYRNLLARGVPVVNESGSVQEWVGTCIDITERKQAEENMIVYQNRLKSLASQLVLSEEQSRHEIAAELHDRVGQALAFTRLELDTARQSSSQPEVAEKLKNVSKTMLEVIDDLHTLSFDLSSPVLREFGLEAAISDLLDERLKKMLGLQGQFIDDGKQKPLDENVKAIMFRSVRELVTNVIKHARASRINITAERIDDQIRVVVEDNGVGFDTAKAADRASRKETFGLFSIEEQLSSLGGELRIFSEPGEGTTAMLTAPFKKD